MPPSSIRVRLAEASDIPGLVALMTEFYAESAFPLAPEPAARTFEALISDPRLGRVWLLEHEGEIAGHAVLTLCFSMEFGGLRGFVDDFFVRPSFRGRGVAGAALAEIRRSCESLGVWALLVETSADNPKALSVYRRAGFTDSGRLLMTLPVASPLHEV